MSYGVMKIFWGVGDLSVQKDRERSRSFLGPVNKAGS